MKRFLTILLILATPCFAQYPTPTNLNGLVISKPADSDQVSQGAGAIRQTKQAIIQTFQDEHQLDGRHIRFFGIDTGTVNNVQIYIPIATSFYEPGMIFTFLPAKTNTGSTTLTVVNTNGTSLGTAPILYNGNSLQTSYLVPSNICEVVYDGNNFQMIGTPTNVFVSALTNGQFLVSNAGTQTAVASTNAMVSLFTSQSPPFIPTNTYSQILVDCDVFFVNTAGSDHLFDLASTGGFAIYSGGTTSYPVALGNTGINGAQYALYAHFAFGQPLPNGGTLDFRVQPDANSANLSAQLLNFRVTGVR